MKNNSGIRRGIRQLDKFLVSLKNESLFLHKEIIENAYLTRLLRTANIQTILLHNFSALSFVTYHKHCIYSWNTFDLMLQNKISLCFFKTDKGNINHKTFVLTGNKISKERTFPFYDVTSSMKKLKNGLEDLETMAKSNVSKSRSVLGPYKKLNGHKIDFNVGNLKVSIEY